jgi:hypothetical protein
MATYQALVLATASVYLPTVKQPLAQGKVYMYTRTNNTWTHQAGLLASNGGANDIFGSSVSLSNNGNVALVGAPGEFRYSKSYIFTRSTTGTAEKTASKIVIFPSIVSDELTIQYDATITISSVHITNTIGQTVLVQKNLDHNTLNIQHLPRGIYLVSVQNTEGGITTGKIVKN